MAGATEGLYKKGNGSCEKVLDKSKTSAAYAEYILKKCAKIFEEEEKVQVVVVNIKKSWETKTTTKKKGVFFKTKKVIKHKEDYSKKTEFQGFYKVGGLPHYEIRIVMNPGTPTKEAFIRDTHVIDRKFWSTLKTTDCGGKIPIIKVYRGKTRLDKLTLNEGTASKVAESTVGSTVGSTAPTGDMGAEEKFQDTLSTRIYNFFSKLKEDRQAVYRANKWPYDQADAESLSIDSERSAAYGHIKALKAGADGSMLLERYLSDVRMKFVCQNFADLTITAPAGSI